MKTDEEQLRLYTLWSNFIYFIVGLYSIIIAFLLYCKEKIIKDFFFFSLYGIIILCTGTFSVLYHLKNPSWTNDPETVHTEKYKHSLSLDVGFAYTTIALSFLFLLYRMYCVYSKEKSLKSLIKFLEDPNAFFSLMFMILSGVFYFLGDYYFDEATGQCVKKTEEEKAMACFEDKISAYDVFHSNWHIFASITGIFWLNMLKNSYFYTQ